MFKISKFSASRPNPNRTEAVARRIVKNARWVHTNELKMGMYVKELDIPWEDTQFMFQGFVIDSVKLLHEVQAAADYACIESEKIASISATGGNRLCGGVRTR